MHKRRDNIFFNSKNSKFKSINLINHSTSATIKKLQHQLSNNHFHRVEKNENERGGLVSMFFQ
jgi:hypothetical protein